MNKPVEIAQANAGIAAEYGHFIGGEWVAPASGKTIDLINPSNGQVLSRIAAGNSTSS